MWPIRAQRLTDLIPVEELRRLLSREGDVTSGMTFCEVSADGEISSVDADPRAERERPDPFCTFFRHGEVDEETGGRPQRVPAFEGADAACARCEQKLARHYLIPSNSRERGAPKEVTRRRCHMGLTDSFVEVEVAGQTVGGLIAGRRIAREEDRQRIRKSVGKLGKLTRAEKEHFDASEHIVIRPHDDGTRSRLVKEIDSISPCSDDLDARLKERAALLTRLAERRFEAFRRRQEELLLEPARTWPDEIPNSQGRILADLAAQLSHLRLSLDLSYVAFFARPPDCMDDADRALELVTESGLDLPRTERGIELDWSRIPPLATGEGADVSRGLEAVSSLIGALRATAAAPKDLKGRLTKSLFLAPIEVGSNWHGAVAFGGSSSSIEPTADDYRFLCRIGRALVRRYYSFCMAVERTVLRRRVGELEKELGALEKERKEEERRKARTPPGQRFDLRKLLEECRQKLLPAAEARSLPIDARELADRLVVVGERRQIRDVLHQILTMGIERSCSDKESQPLSPLRLVLKRRGRNAVVSIEVIGRFMGAGEQRRLFRRTSGPVKGTGPAEATRRVALGGAPTEDAPGAKAEEKTPDLEKVGTAPQEAANGPEAATTGSLRRVQEVVRAHFGRFRVDSERLHRFADDEHRWMGKTTFLVELPLAPRVAAP